jgi:hypothetical protein
MRRGRMISKKSTATAMALASLAVLLMVVGSYAVEITNVAWDSTQRIIHISLDAWPETWPGWTVYLDGSVFAISEEGGEGDPVVRPNAALDAPPTGLIIGTLPWVSPLDGAVFPCCGTIQLDIPGHGLTNIYSFNLRDFGCATASSKECPSEWTVHEGDLVVGGTDTLVIEGAQFFQKGNIYINDSATLTVRNSKLMVARGDVPTIHVYFFVAPGATLQIDHSEVYPPPGGGLVCVINRGSVQITDSPTSIHYFDMSGGAELTMANSELIYDIGGLLQITGGTTSVADSVLGALGLRVPPGGHLEASGLHSGMYLESWDVHSLIPDADYEVVLNRTTILQDTFTGPLEHGPYERGWILFLDPSAHVRLSDSELRKVFLDITNSTAEFQGLRVGVPSSLTYRDIVLENVVVKGQWPFTIRDSTVTISDSDYLFLQPSGTATVTLHDAHMVEFIPRDFFGTMIFENSVWTTAGEILGGVPYHSTGNDFTMRGSLRMEGLRENLQWENARVTREFDVVATDVTGSPVGGLQVKVGGGTYTTDSTGRTAFDLVFTEANYNQPTSVEAWRSASLIRQWDLDFFTSTPILVEGLSTSTAAAFRVTAAGDVLGDGTFFGAAFLSGSADVAEWVSVSGPVEPGTVLELDPQQPGAYRPSQGACSSLVGGVVTTEPGFVLGSPTPYVLPTPNAQALLALSGIVPVKVTNEGGPIQPGDLLVSSSTPGYAMRWAGDGPCSCALVGKALEPMLEDHGVISILLTAH